MYRSLRKTSIIVRGKTTLLWVSGGGSTQLQGPELERRRLVLLRLRSKLLLLELFALLIMLSWSEFPLPLCDIELTEIYEVIFAYKERALAMMIICNLLFVPFALFGLFVYLKAFYSSWAANVLNVNTAWAAKLTFCGATRHWSIAKHWKAMGMIISIKKRQSRAAHVRCLLYLDVACIISELSASALICITRTL